MCTVNKLPICLENVAKQLAEALFVFSFKIIYIDEISVFTLMIHLNVILPIMFNVI